MRQVNPRTFAQLGLMYVCLSFFGTAVCADSIRIRNGLTGVVDTPSAFQQADAQSAVVLSSDDKVRTVSLAFQALPRLETSLNFSSFDNFSSGFPKDSTSLNLKFQLSEEGEYRPAISVGIDNLFSSSAESAEYIVASKKIGSQFRATIGAGWGRLGGYGNAGEVTAARPPASVKSRVEFSHLFEGDVAMFGGVEWDTPIQGLTLAAEYSSAATYGTDTAPESRFNFAAKYRVADGLDVIAFNRGGDTTGLTLSFFANPHSPPSPPDYGNVAPLIEPRSEKGRDSIEWASDETEVTSLLAGTIEALNDQSIQLIHFAATGRKLRVGVTALDPSSVTRLTGRTVRVLSRVSPASVTTFEITTYLGGLPTKTFIVPREQVVALADQPLRGLQSLELISINGAMPDADDWNWSLPTKGGFSWNLTPAISIPFDTTGGLDPVLGIYATGRYDWSATTYFSGTLSYLIAGNKTISAPPAEPTPRSDSGSYDRDSISLDRLYGAFSRKVSKTSYAGLTFGLLERGYRGISAETLWMPDGKSWAIGAELTYAQKRDYEDPFGSLDFEAVTGFLSVYWDTSYKGLSAQVDVGQYLAGDLGATLALSRSFPNGWAVSAFTTITEDNRREALKLGATVSIPLSTFAPINTRRRSTLRLGGNYGDAGARVSVPDPLIRRVGDARSQRIEDAWSDFWN